jgi:hypothetical protein
MVGVALMVRVLLLAAGGCVLAGWGVPPEGLAARSGSAPDRIIAGLQATAARERGLVESFVTNKTFTIMHDGETRARVVAALQFTAPDVKAFSILESNGSGLLRDRVINRMMQTEVTITQGSNRTRVAISSDNYEFGDVLDDGDDFVIEVVPRRRDELLFKGRVWITKEGSHLKRIEGEPAKNPSFWIRRIQFVSDYAPVNGVWLHGRTLARVKVRWLGEYLVLAECGTYDMVLVSDNVNPS